MYDLLNIMCSCPVMYQRRRVRKVRKRPWNWATGGQGAAVRAVSSSIFLSARPPIEDTHAIWQPSTPICVFLRTNSSASSWPPPAREVLEPKTLPRLVLLVRLIHISLSGYWGGLVGYGLWSTTSSGRGVFAV